MKTRKVLVKEGDVAIIACPFCREIKKLSVAQDKEKRKRELRIKCSCANIFCLCLEYRKHPRKPIRLVGKSINLSKHQSQDVMIKNISLGGVGFSPFKMHRTQEDDRMRIAFILNDTRHTPIDTQVTVRSAFNDYIGCEFNTTQNFKTSLGFYLLC